MRSPKTAVIESNKTCNSVKECISRSKKYEVINIISVIVSYCDTDDRCV